VLVTPEGNHVRIPNSVIFKEILVNSTASPSSRNSFDVVIPNEASVADAIGAIHRSLGEQDGVLRDPPPRALVEALEPGGVRLRVYFWAPSHSVDWFQLMSEAKLRARVALQHAGIIESQGNSARGGTDGSRERANTDQPRPAVASEQAHSNPQRDAEAAASPHTVPGKGRETPMERVLEQPESRVSEEGTNLLTAAKAE
jgi:small conductance mechanosensitive channel